jgi:hypothetical protein
VLLFAFVISRQHEVQAHENEFLPGAALSTASVFLQLLILRDGGSPQEPLLDLLLPA